jgi:GTP cyclohydrolase FolE2
VRRIRDNAIGRDDYSTSDFVEDVKRACAREAVPFDNDIFNELAR